MSQLNTGTLLQRLDLLQNSKLLSSSTTTPVDVSGYVGDIKVDFSAFSYGGSSPTLDVAARTGATTGAMAEISGKVFTQVSNSGGTGFQTMTLDTRALNKWLDFAYTLSSAASFGCSIVGNAIKSTQ